LSSLLSAGFLTIIVDVLGFSAISFSTDFLSLPESSVVAGFSAFITVVVFCTGGGISSGLASLAVSLDSETFQFSVTGGTAGVAFPSAKEPVSFSLGFLLTAALGTVLVLALSHASSLDFSSLSLFFGCSLGGGTPKPPLCLVLSRNRSARSTGPLDDVVLGGWPPFLNGLSSLESRASLRLLLS
jgi:hypothetical protein